MSRFVHHRNVGDAAGAPQNRRRAARVPRPNVRFFEALLWTVLLLVAASCDSTPAPEDDTLVVEAFFDAGSPLPPVRVTRTLPVSEIGEVAAVDGALVNVRLADREFVYQRDPERAEWFLPAEDDKGVMVTPGATFRVRVSANGQQASAAGSVPPILDLASLDVDVPDEPVAAVFVDTLNIGLDSLNLAIDAREGYIYPIAVSVEWETTSGASATGDYWIQARLLPRNPFSSSLIDFFLLPEQIFREDDSRVVNQPGMPVGRRTWSGVYAVPVDHPDDEVPEHLLRVAVLRSTAEFARFATSKTDPERREPVSNVEGGIGFVGGVSIDSISVTVH